jgi:serine/threonine protein kinase
MAGGVAAAAAHLHGRGILHGDLYAHNTLWDGEAGGAVLSDFGAACALPQGDEGDAWRRVEARAWGLFLGELLDRCAPEPEAMARLRELESACVQSVPSARPLMSEIVEALQREAQGV